jgi:hypothetical protein
VPFCTPRILTYEFVRERIQAELKASLDAKKALAQVARVAAAPVVVPPTDKPKGSLPFMKTIEPEIPRHKRELGRKSKVS